MAKPEAGGIALSWPGNATGYTLQSAETLLPFPVWNPLNQNVELLNGRRRVNIMFSPAITQQFFRLTKP